MKASHKNCQFDTILTKIVSYSNQKMPFKDETLQTASYCLMDSIGCAIKSLNFQACTRLLGPMFGDKSNDHLTVKIPGTNYALDPIEAAFNITTMIRWLDFNDTWLAKEWGHPSDNLGAIIATTQWKSRTAGKIKIEQLLTNLIKSHEIQGVLALENSFNNVGVDHVILVKLASTAIGAHILGLPLETQLNAISHVFLDGNALRTYRHFPNTGSRKSWAAGDAASRAVFLLRLAEKGEMGYPKVLTAKNWGFYDTVLGGKEMILEQPFASYVMDNILFKISFPAEFHAQTAVEAAISLHKKVINRLDEILEIRIRTHESAIRIIDKKGPLNNPADRDHCIQYMVAVGLIFGRLQANDYEDSVAQDPRIDKIREKITCFEDTRFTRDYLDPNKRSIANGVEIQFQNGTKLEEVIVEYPLGHKKRRLEGKPFLIQKFKDNMSDHFSKEQIEELVDFFENINEVKHKHTDFLLDKLWRG